jgi:lipopolysaccharide transport system ATP-binding protein
MLLNHGTLITRGASEDVVAHYLTHNLGLDAYRAWPELAVAPGDDVVRLRSVRVIDEEGKTSYSIDIRRPVGIELIYDVLRPDQKVVPYFSLLNSRDMIVFTSEDTDAAWRSTPRPLGRYTSVAWIPGNLLAEGDLRVLAAVGSDDRDLRHVEDVEAAAFQVIDSPDGDSARMDHAGGIRGVIRPYMAWSTEYYQV